MKERMGLGAAVTAFAMWGLLPLYWKLLAHVPAVEVLAHRILWTAVLTVIVLGFGGRLGDIGALLRDRKRLLPTLAASFLISANGLTFVWAVAAGRIAEVSLGYYITPLLNVVLGFAVLGERPTRLQMGAICLAAFGVLQQTLAVGKFPWVSLVLAACFGFYGLVRKKAPVDALVGLSGEMLIAAPLAVLYLAIGPDTAFGIFTAFEPRDMGLLVASGVASALPLYLFAYGTRRVKYTTIGLIMYLAPTCQLGVAVLVYGEPFTQAQAITFGCIWTAIAIYMSSMLRQARQVAAATAGSAP